MTWLLGHIRIVGILSAIMAVFASGAYVGVEFEKGLSERALRAQESNLIAQCEKDKAITTEASKAYETSISTLNNRLIALKRMHPKACVPVTSATAGHNATTSTGKPAGAHGVAAESLYDFAGEAETYRLRLVACQGFVKSVWDRK